MPTSESHIFSPQKIKSDFPIFRRRINGHPVTYLDSASTTQKPKSVIQALTHFYENTNANIHRGIYKLSQEATEQYEETREAVKNFINAKSASEIIFTKNATEGVNLVAYAWGRNHLKKGDIVLASALEHHSNLVPWQLLCKETGARLEIIPLDKNFGLDLSKLDQILTKKVKLVGLTHASNVTGMIVPIEKIIKKAHQIGAIVFVDGAQSVPHIPIDVQKIDCDFMAFSSHKMLGPTGVGILFGKKEILESLPPFLCGGDMIKEVKQHSARWNDIPWKFEAGTPNIADVIALKKAIDYLKKIGMENVLKHDQKLLAYAKSKLQKMPEIEMYAPKKLRAQSADAQRGEKSGSTSSETSEPIIENCTGILSFNVKSVHPHDTAEILSQEGICIRSGHHCCQPLLERLGVTATARMSFYIYNDKKDIDRAVSAIKKVIKIFRPKPQITRHPPDATGQ